MASFSGFLRKAPSERIRAFFDAHAVHIPEDFNWASDGRLAAFVKSLSELIDGLPDRQQDRLRADLDLLANLSDAHGLTAAEQICAGRGIDLEGMGGVQDVLLMLAVEHPGLLDRIASDASMLRRTGGRDWSTFQFEDDGKPWALDSQQARDEFLSDAIAILDLPEHRKREADWYTSIRTHPITGEETEILQATIYVEARAESELSFGNASTLERRLVQKVMEVGIACDPAARIVEICAKGGKKVRDKYAKSFAQHFAPHAPPPVEVPRRDVLLDRLKSATAFDLDPADGIERVEVSSLDFFAMGGGFARFEKRGDVETVHEFLNRKLGAASPLRASGWELLSATLRIVLAGRDGKRSRTLTVTLRAPNTTTLPNKTEKDRQFVFLLLERWGLLAPAPDAEDTDEVLE